MKENMTGRERFKTNHPELAKWISQIFHFIVFSMGVTIVQYLVFTFLPGILGFRLAGTEFMIPRKDLELFGVPFTWSLIGSPVHYDAAGAVVIGGVSVVIFFFVFKIIFPEGEAK